LAQSVRDSVRESACLSSAFFVAGRAHCHGILVSIGANLVVYGLIREAGFTVRDALVLAVAWKGRRRCMLDRWELSMSCIGSYVLGCSLTPWQAMLLPPAV
jgi:hypothetical protein